MYNYFTLLDDLQDTLIFLRSLPVCTIVFNKNADIIDINNAASDFLKIRNIKEYTSRKLKLEVDSQFHTITEGLQKGETTGNVMFEFKRPDHSSVSVHLNASLFYGLKDVFIFQFSEIEPAKPN